MQRHYGHRLRKGRRSESGRAYLVTSVTYQRVPLFHDLQLGRLVVRAMRYFHDSGQVASLCFVVMPDHLHWLFQLTAERPLPSVVNGLKTWTARQINRERNRHGAVWQMGFHDRAVRRNEDLRSVARYVVANPLRAGLVDRIEEYSLWDAAWIEGSEIC